MNSAISKIKRRSKFILILFFIIGNSFAQEVKHITIETNDFNLVYRIGKNKKLYQVYLGEKLSDPSSYPLLKQNGFAFTFIYIH